MGKTANLTVKGGIHCLATPMIGGLYSYHIYPVMVIFFLVGFGPFSDSITFNIVGRHERRRAASLGLANVISAMMVEDFSWFYYRWLLPLDNDLIRLIDVNFRLDNYEFGLDIYTTYLIYYWYLRHTLLVYYCKYRSSWRVLLLCF